MQSSYIRTKFEWHDAIWSWGGFAVCMIAGLLVIGIITIYSASYNHKTGLYNAYAYKQIAFALAALVPFLLVLRLDYAWLTRYAVVIYGIGIGLLILTALFGTFRNESKRWLNLGVVMLQTSEVMKLAIIPILAKILTEYKNGTIMDLLLPLGLASVPMGLIVVQPDLGTSLVFLPIVFAMCFAAGVPVRYFIIVILIMTLVGIIVYSYGMHDYQRKRVLMFIRQDNMTQEEKQGSGYHLCQSKIAFGNGGALGRGWQKGTQGRYGYLPERHTDFIFAVIGEEFGFIGTCCVLLLYLGLFVGMLNLAASTLVNSGQLIVVGIWSILLTHTVVNTAMTIGLLPITGLPLPFVSYGGSSLLFNFLEIGLIFSIAGRRIAS